MEQGALPWRVGALEESVKQHEEMLADQGTRLVRGEEAHKAMAIKLDGVADSQSSTNNWLRTIAGGVIVALILLVLNLILGTHVVLPKP